MSSRWGDDKVDKELRRKEKEEKARKKLLKQQRLNDEALLRKQHEEQKVATADATAAAEAQDEDDGRPAKRQRVDVAGYDANEESKPLFRFQNPRWGPCRHVKNFETLNAIEEGSYGWVSRARDISTGEIVALKRLKMDSLQEGFPVTALREIQTLKESCHANIVDLREVVAGESLTEIYLVMEFIEHDLKTLQESMSEPFMPSEVKTLLHQITSAVAYLHTNWILHRDLKTSNILLNNRGEAKLADFGMARHFGDPPPPHMTQLVVTLWYRAPELLLGAEKYDHAIDVWSLGCIFGELLRNEPLLPGKSEVDELAKIFALCGLPDDRSWPRFRSLPNARALKLPARSSSEKQPSEKMSILFPELSAAGKRLFEHMLALNPNRRPDAAEILEHPWFQEDPRPKSSAMFPTFPSKAGQERRRRARTPQAPRRGAAPKLDNADFSGMVG